MASEWGQGSTFTVELPIVHRPATPPAEPEVALTEDLPEDQPLAEDSNVEPGFAPVPSGQPAADAPLLLIVEDNADVVAYLQACLGQRYRLLVARDGREGIDTALREVPDLIVSDVMMPDVDGFTLCRTLKRDRLSSHIPIVLLTARADRDSRLEGLEEGADAYLAKPFDERELLVTLRKLHELRARLREHYAGMARSGDAAPTTAQTTSQALPPAEAAFFEQLHAILDNRLDESSLPVDELAQEMAMSRTQLFRKLQALAGSNIEDYVRDYRLDKAYHLLESTDRSVKEVAYDVGFTDPAYFSRAFRKRFGRPPSEV